MLNETQIATLRAAVDRIIPPDDQTPGGVDAGAFDYLLRQLAPSGDLHRSLPTYCEGLDALETLAGDTHGAAFADLNDSLQDAVLIAFADQKPAFFRALVEQAQEGFYTSPAAWHMIGWKVNG